MKRVAIASVPLLVGLVWSAAPSSAVAKQEQQQVYETRDVAVLPVVTYDAKPQYTPDAMRAGVHGGILLDGVVHTNGTVSDIRVLRSLDPGLDQEAVKSFAKWTFKPARMKDGRPVAVRVSVEVTFNLREGPQDPVYLPSSEVSAPTVMTEVKPAYPDEAREAGVTGVVRLECVVRRDGKPGDIVVTSLLHPALDRAAVEALKQWRFNPGMRKGSPVSVRIQLTIAFDAR